MPPLPVIRKAIVPPIKGSVPVKRASGNPPSRIIVNPAPANGKRIAVVAPIKGSVPVKKAGGNPPSKIIVNPAPANGQRKAVVAPKPVVPSKSVAPPKPDVKQP